MGIFEQFPYTNMHDTNLDWIIRQVKENATNILKLLGSEEISSEENDITLVKFSKNLDDTWVASKTVEELKQAIEAGKMLIGVLYNDTEVALLTRYTFAAGANRFIFSGFRNVAQTVGSNVLTLSTVAATMRNLTEGADPDTVSVALNKVTIEAYAEEDDNA